MSDTREPSPANTDQQLREQIVALEARLRELERSAGAAEDRYRLLANLPDIIYSLDGQGNVVTVNGKGLERYGYSEQVCLGRPFLAFIHPEDQPSVFESLMRALAERREHTSGLQFRVVATDGTAHWVELSARARFGEDGAYLGEDGVLRDISERKQAQEVITTDRNKLNSIIAALPAHLTIRDLEFRLLYQSPPSLRVFGDRTGEKCHQVFQALDQPCEGCPVRLAMQDGRVHTHVAEVRLPSGEVTYWENVANPIRDASGALVSCLEISTDVTARTQAARTLQESEARFRSLLQDVETVAVQGYDAEGITLYWNRASERLYGYSAEEAVGVSIFDLIVPPDRHAEVAETIRRSTMTGQPMSASELSLVRKDGSSVSVFSSHAVVRIPGRMPELFCVDVDLSERTLAAEVKERLERQLQHAQKMESIGRLAGGVAHDFNNMLGVILGHSDLALEQVAPEWTLHEDLTAIRDAATRSAELTRQLLAFARQQTIAPRALDLNAAITGTFKMLQRLIGEDIVLSWRASPDLWKVHLDPSQLDQVLANLCVNARDAINGVGTVTLEAANRTLDEVRGEPVRGAFVELTVRDDGCGMNEDTQARLFEPFFTTKEVGKGTGLGLATVYGIVKQNHGFIDVSSKPGQGTTFRILFPRYEGQADPLRAAGEALMRGRETIMLVEDEPDMLRVTARMLTAHGYTVLAASSPREAVRRVAEHSGAIDLVITDVVMPEMNGRDLAKHLLSRTPNLRTLFMSGYTADVIADHGVLPDGLDFIQKPFTRDALAAKVREVLNRS